MRTALLMEQRYYNLLNIILRHSLFSKKSFATSFKFITLFFHNVQQSAMDEALLRHSRILVSLATIGY